MQLYNYKVIHELQNTCKGFLALVCMYDEAAARTHGVLSNLFFITV